MMFSLAGYSVECNIFALIYINRITIGNKMPLTMQNWRGLWIACVIIAQKVSDDCPLRTSFFVRILPNTTKEQLRDIESSAFRWLNYSTTVRPSMYAQYYFGLRQVFMGITGADQLRNLDLKPMTVVEATRLEYRTSFQGGVSIRSTSMPPANTDTPNGKFCPITKSKTLDDAKSVGRYVIS